MTKLLSLLRFLAIALTSLSTLALTDMSYAAGRVFYDDFESGTTGKWAQNGFRDLCTPVRKAIDGGDTQTGSFMLQCNWNGKVAWNDPAAHSMVMLPSWIYANEFFIRFWVRYDTDVDPKPGAKLLRLGQSTGPNSYVALAQNEIQPTAPMFSILEQIDGVLPNPLKRSYGSRAVGDRKWHKIEMYFRIAGSNGSIFRLWVDGALDHEETGWSANPANKWYPLHLMSNWSNNPGWEHDASNHVYWDNVEVFSDMGTGGIGSMSDATIRDGAAASLPPPLNVRLQP